MRIVLIGNCQISNVAPAIRFMLPDASVRSVFVRTMKGSDWDDLIKDLPKYDLIIKIQNSLGKIDFGSKNYEPLTNQNLVVLPSLTFGGFQPDMKYIQKKSGGYLGPFSDYSSSIVVLGFLSGLSAQQAIKLYQPAAYAALGWDFNSAVEALVCRYDQFSLDIRDYVADWLRFGPFMATINHPKLRPVADITRQTLEKLGLPLRDGNVADYVPEPILGTVWPTPPGLQLPQGVSQGASFFKLRDFAMNGDGGSPKFLNLEEYINLAYQKFAGLTLDQIEYPAFTSMSEKLAPVIDSIRTSEAARGHRGGIRLNPYKILPGFHWWRKAIVDVPLREINPMVNPAFKVGRSDRIGAVGSCFAQHISRRLSKSGFNYFITEEPPPELTAQEAINRSYGLFSARYGNIYTVRQLHQLFHRAFGTFEPNDSAWQSIHTGFIDPFRPEIEPERFLSEAEVLSARQKHLSAVRRLFTEVDVLVFTLGLTESWRAKSDGAVFPLAPGAVANVPDPAAYEFVNFGFEEVRSDLLAVIDDVRAINPGAKFILTVSPVPLIATYENRHVLTSTVASKSIIRAVADEVCRKHNGIMYFPSYEIITMAAARGEYFEDDFRSVTEKGVDHVMEIFFKTCTQASEKHSASPVSALLAELEEISQVVCDEEVIERIHAKLH